MDVSLILVPYHAGDDGVASSEGPHHLCDAGAQSVLRSCGVAVAVETVERGEPFRDTAASAARVNKELAKQVRSTADAHRLPVVLTGSCNSAMGVLAGLERGRCGAVWLDAHADFNTPDTTVSGFFAGMSLAVVTGHCYGTYWAAIGDSTPLAEDLIVMYGVRDLSPPAEGNRLAQSAITVVPWLDRRPDGHVLEPLDELARRIDEVYLHIDFDVFDPEVAPGVVDEPVPGGMSFEDAETIMRATTERFRIRAATLATFTPDRDYGDKTATLGLRLIELLGEYARTTDR
jgi:arginase